MNLRADTFVAQGYSHLVCQDYAIHGLREEGPFVVLADGCSSAPNTDVGARLICYAAQRYLKATRGRLDRKDMVSKIMHRALMSCEILDIDPMCLHATLMIMYTTKEGVHVESFGDGHLVILYTDASSRHYSVSFPNEMPWYPLYHIMPKLMVRYAEMTNGVEPILSRDLKDLIMKGREEGEYYRFETIDGLSHFIPEFHAFKTIAIASDGLGTFVSQPPDEMGTEDPRGIAFDLLNFQSTKGEFLKRRVGKTLKRYKSGDGDRYDHYDDLSIGAIIKDPS